MYNPLANGTYSASTTNNTVGAEGWEQDFLEAEKLMAEMTADSVADYANSCAVNFKSEVASIVKASTDNNGLDATGAALVNAATKLMAQLGVPQDTLPVLAGESFVSDADRLTHTVMAGEALDIKGKLEAIWEWIKEKFTKARAWLMKKFDGAARLAKSFRALAEAAKKAQTDGKVAKKGKKLKVSKAQLKTFSLDTALSDLKASNVKGLVTALDKYKTAADTEITFINNDIAKLDDMVKAVKGEDDKDLANVTEAASKIDVVTRSNVTGLNIGNLQVFKQKGDASDYDDSSVAKVISSVKTEVENRYLSTEPLDIAKTAKFSDKEVAPLSLSDVVSICDDIVTTLDNVAKSKDSYNKGMDVEKNLGDVIKEIKNMDEDAGKHSQNLLDIGNKMTTAIRNNIVSVNNAVTSSAADIYSVCKGSLALYGKEA